MRNAYNRSATSLATTQQQQQQQQQQQRKQQLETDHIITISTASLTEQLQQVPLKEGTTAAATSPTATATREATARGGATATGGATAAATVAASHTTTTTSSSSSTSSVLCCRWSQVISYQNNIADVQHRRGRRLHGLQLPLHPLQLFGWLVLLLFGLASYWVLIPAFHAPIQGPLYGLITGLYVVHIAAHLTALLTDPADKELRRVHRNDRIVPEFDRTKHGHVIENGRCHLCNIRTSSARTKHCSVCNKCVGKFDHHCKWLNHCIGSRNYVAFLMCVVSAVVASLVIVAAVIGQIVLYYVQPDWLSFYWCNQAPQVAAGLDSSDYINLTLSLGSNSSMLLLLDQDQQQQQHQHPHQHQQQPQEKLDQAEQQQRAEHVDYLDMEMNLTVSTLPTLLDNFTALLEQSSTVGLQAMPGVNHTVTPLVAGIGVHETIYLLLLGVLGLLAAISAGLLLHLCFFHIYISFLGLTTYEYIRNHRQAQEAKAKQLLEQGKNGGVHFQTHLPTVNHPSKAVAGAAATQLYCCSSVPHPSQPNPIAPELQTDQAGAGAAHRLHCCASSREFHQARQAIYVCSLLQEHRRSSHHLQQLELDPQHEETALRSFHCCSSFAAASMQRRVSAAANVKTSLEPPRQRVGAATGAAIGGGSAYVQYTEQCTLCTFQLRSPLRTGVGSAVGSSSTRTLANSQTATPSSSSASAAGNISKHQRWRRKWNCCASVPDSPDVPNDLLAALSYREHASKINATELPVQFIRGLDVPHATTELPALKTPRSSRLRHMLRLLGRYRRGRCHRGGGGVGAGAGGGAHGVAAAEQLHVAAIKQNQIRPLQLQPGRMSYTNDNLSITTATTATTTPQPPATSSPSGSGGSSSSSSSSCGASSSELSTDHCIPTTGTKELMLLPTSVIRDDHVTTSYTMTLPPALPPPTRRKMPNASELAELAETLGFISSQSQSQQQQHHHQHTTTTSSSTSSSRQLPGLGNVYRRQRRKHFLRTRSPTLSPIHESGLSNPTSPQPLRHSLGAAGSAVAKCSPDVARSSATLVQNLCGLAGEAMRKTASNTSLQSISSNSSST